MGAGNVPTQEWHRLRTSAGAGRLGTRLNAPHHEKVGHFRSLWVTGACKRGNKAGVSASQLQALRAAMLQIVNAIQLNAPLVGGSAGLWYTCGAKRCWGMAKNTLNNAASMLELRTLKIRISH